MNTSPYITGLHLPKSRRKARSTQEIFTNKMTQLKLKSFSQLGECFSNFIPDKLLHPAKSGAMSRQRLFSKKNTFWAFFSQILDADSGCKEAVRKLQASVAVKFKSVPSSSTAAYCKARKKLELPMLESIHQHLTDHLKTAASADCLNGRRIIVVDGTGVSMPDTEENQQKWPQLRSQKPGCGFPQAFICACFNLNNGALLSHKMGDKKSSELPMLREQWETFKKGDVFLGDKGFCSYYDQSNLKDRGVDSIITLARRTPVSEAEAGKVLGQNDLLIHWLKPKRNKRSSYSQEDWEALPETLPLRQIKVIVHQPGFRTKLFYIITTLLDEKAYPASELAEVYFKRWDVELFFRDIKTTMDMDILRCKSPDMVRKEVLMHMIVYNCIRALIAQAVKETATKTRRISFKASIQALRQWQPYLNQANITQQEQRRLIQLLYTSIAESTVVERPGRSEPRAVKRRPKNHQLLNKPRHEMNPIPHRSKYQAQMS